MAANISNTSQAVENLVAANPPLSAQGLTPVQQAQNIVNPGSVTPAALQDTSNVGGAVANPFYPNPSSANWGAAAPANAQARTVAAGNDFNGEPPIIYYMTMRPVGEGGQMIPIPESYPNPAYIQVLAQKEEARKQAAADAERAPVSEVKTPLEEEVDKLIADSQEVTDEVRVNTPPEAPVVDIKQDEVIPPPPITPTELVLANQANCDGSINKQDINIEVINNIDFQNTSNFSASLSATAIAFATASATATAGL